MSKGKASHVNGAVRYTPVNNDVSKPITPELENDNPVAHAHVPLVMEKEEEQDDGGPCGWGSVQPKACQRARRPCCVLIWLCMAGAVQGMVVNGFINVVISSIERRYDLKSTESGTIASCYDIASVLCLIPVSYFGGLGCKPRYLGIGVLVMGIGSIVFALPHLVSGIYDIGDGSDDILCDPSTNATVSCQSQANLANYKYVFFLAQLLHGAGASPLYTLGVTYLDENLPLRSSSLYIGIFYAFAIVGPAIGYLAGGAFLNVYVDVNTVDTSTLKITPNSPKWVGAWWIGFLISAFLAFIIAFPLCGFPTSLPGSAAYKLEREKEVYRGKQDAKPTSPEGKGFRLQKIWKSVKVLITNPTFMFLNLAAACEGNLLAGFATFTPKFIEAQFSLQSSTAAQIVGYAAVPAGGGGTFIGGYIVKRFNLRVRGIIKLCLAVTLPCILGTLVFLVRCQDMPFAGVNINYGEYGLNSSINFKGKLETDTCNENCGCSLEEYNPVCGADNVIYYSPCYAGCNVVDLNKEPVEYYNCSCIAYDAQHGSLDYHATTGRCESSCSYLPLFMPIFGIVMLLTFIASMPALSATLRSVPQEERSFALGIQWIIARCLGSIPGPILFGKMIDLTCLLWQSVCGENGSCFFYDNSKMSYNLLGISLAGKTLSAIFFFLALLLYKAPPGGEAEDTKVEEQNKNGGLSKQNAKNNHSIDTLTTSVHEEALTSNSNGNISDVKVVRYGSTENVNDTSAQVSKL